MPYNGIPNSKNLVWLLVFLFKGKTMTTLKGYAKNFNLGVHLKVEFNYQTVMMNWFGPKIRLIGSSQPYWAMTPLFQVSALKTCSGGGYRFGSCGVPSR